MPELNASPRKEKKNNSISKQDGSLAKLLAEETAVVEQSPTMLNASEHAHTLASPSEVAHRAKLRKKKQFGFGYVPAFVVEGYAQLAEERGLSKRHLLYALLREAGVDIPPDEIMDGRTL